MLSRAYVEQKVIEGGYSQVFAGSVNKALEDWKKVVARNPEEMAGAIPRERATFVNRRVVERIYNELTGQPNVLFHEGTQNTLLTIKDGIDEVTVRCKKLTEAMRAMNIRTGRVTDLFYKQLPLRGEFARHVNVTFGWYLNQHGILQKLAIVNEYQDKLYWQIEINDTGATQAVYENTSLFAESDGWDLTLRDTERSRRIAKEIAEEIRREAAADDASS